MSDELASTTREPWARQPDETDRQWLGFRIYRDLGPLRTLAEAEKRYMDEQGKDLASSERAMDESDLPTSRFGRWSSQNNWVDRAAAWDRYQDRQHRRKIIEKRQEAMDRLAEQAPNAALLLSAVALQKEDEVAGIDPDDLDNKQLVALRDLLTRVGVDSPDELRVETDAPYEGLGVGHLRLGQLSDDELIERLDELKGQLADDVDDPDLLDVTPDDGEADGGD